MPPYTCCVVVVDDKGDRKVFERKLPFSYFARQKYSTTFYMGINPLLER